MNELHRWDLTPKEAIALQRELAGQIISQPLTSPVKLLAGTDCSFLDHGKKIFAVAVLLDAKTLELVHVSHTVLECRMPYIPGLLSFREAPAVLEALNNLPQKPDLILCGGQGIAHPRGLGIAAHIGLCIDIPTIGVAKSVLCGTYRMPGENRRCHTQLKYHDSVIGSVMRTRSKVKPLFISTGHKITLKEAISWTLKAGNGYRLPEPTRQADRLASKLKKLY